VPDFTHLDEQGRASMVDVTAKPETLRRAVARCRVEGFVGGAPPSIAADGGTTLSDLLGAARLSGIYGAKSTSALIPLCHPLSLSGIDVELEAGSDAVEVTATVETLSRTGVEMEALTACALAGLAVVGACAHEHPKAEVRGLTLWSKSGGRSGTWQRDERGMRSVDEASEPSPGGRNGVDR
jgi:cyclic pyranopterin phosphate synthase